MSAGKSGAVMDEEDPRAGMLAAGILIAAGVIAGIAMRRSGR
jgi:hypothetical protein